MHAGGARGLIQLVCIGPVFSAVLTCNRPKKLSLLVSPCHAINGKMPEASKQSVALIESISLCYISNHNIMIQLFVRVPAGFGQQVEAGCQQVLISRLTCMVLGSCASR